MNNYEQKDIDGLTQKIKDCFNKQDYSGVVFYYREVDEALKNELAYEFGYSFFKTRSEGIPTHESCKEIGKAFQISNYNPKLKEEILKLRYTSAEYYSCCLSLITAGNAKSVPAEKQSELIRLGFNCLLLDYYRDPNVFIASRSDSIIYFLRINVAAVLIKIIQRESYDKAVEFINSFEFGHDLFSKVVDTLFFFAKADRGVDTWIKVGKFLNHLKVASSDNISNKLRTFIATKISECVEVITSYIMKLQNVEEGDNETERLKNYTEHLNKLIDEPLSKAGRKEFDHHVVEEANITKDCLDLFERKEYGNVILKIIKSFPHGLKNATHSVVDYFELSVLKQYDITGDRAYITNALKYYPESEKLKDALLNG